MLKLLIVDDEKGIIDGFKRTIETAEIKEEHKVFDSSDAFRALEIIKEQKPNIIFLDIIMPKKDGLQLLKEIKEESPESQVVMVSARIDIEAKNEALKQGAYEYVEKPVELMQLKKIVLEYIQNKKNLQLKDNVSPTATKPIILILEDNFEQRLILERCIERHYEAIIEITGDGQLAIEIAKRQPIDIGIIDVRLPRMTGYEALKKMRDNGSKLKSIIISGEGQQISIVDAQTLGIEMFIKKPFYPRDIDCQLKVLLKKTDKLIFKN